jgi:hypothetical protein
MFIVVICCNLRGSISSHRQQGPRSLGRLQPSPHPHEIPWDPKTQTRGRQVPVTNDTVEDMSKTWPSTKACVYIYIYNLPISIIITYQYIVLSLLSLWLLWFSCYYCYISLLLLLLLWVVVVLIAIIIYYCYQKMILIYTTIITMI